MRKKDHFDQEAESLFATVLYFVERDEDQCAIDTIAKALRDAVAADRARIAAALAARKAFDDADNAGDYTAALDCIIGMGVEAAEWAKLCEAATPGPWAWESVGEKDNKWCLGTTEPPHEGEIAEDYDEDTCTFSEKPEVIDFIAESGSDGTFADAAFIAAARAALPALLDAVAALTAERDALRQRAEAAERELSRLRIEYDGMDKNWDQWQEEWSHDLHMFLDRADVVKSAHGIPNVRDGAYARIETTLERLRGPLATVAAALTRAGIEVPAEPSQYGEAFGRELAEARRLAIDWHALAGEALHEIARAHDSSVYDAHRADGDKMAKWPETER